MKVDLHSTLPPSLPPSLPPYLRNDMRGVLIRDEHGEGQVLDLAHLLQIQLGDRC